MIPVVWKKSLPYPLAECPELLLAIDLLRHRIQYYTRLLESGDEGQTMVLEPSLFSNPQYVVLRMLGLSTETQINAKVGCTYKTIPMRYVNLIEIKRKTRLE